VESVRKAKTEFLRDELISKPLGFYTWSRELSAIFHQDRFLQQPLEPGPAADLTRALKQTPGAPDAYDAYLRLIGRLTNPPMAPGPQNAGKCPPFFPPARSHEVTLFEKLYADRPIPEEFDLMSELIRRVRAGDIKLEPSDDAGWYDRQTWSLEPLLLPDRKPDATHLEMGKRYRKHLENLFRGALAFARETFVSNMAGGRGGYGGPSRRPLVVHPNLTVEPLPTLYARRAEVYRFVQSVIEAAFGADALTNMHRLTSNGEFKAGLLEELLFIQELFEGASATARTELGIGLPNDRAAAVRRFSEWRAKLSSDADVSRDARMMVPVYYDVQRKKTKVWAFLGWKTVEVDAEYRVPPMVLSIEPLTGTGGPDEPPPVLFCGERNELADAVMAEVYVQRLLDRNEFRRHCDRYKTKEAILANLP
jgi:hypothetical protein